MVQNQAIRLSLGYMRSTPINVILTEACEPLMPDRFKLLGVNYVFRVIARSNHLLLPILDHTRDIVDNPAILKKFPPPFLLECYMESTPFAHLISSSELPNFCLYPSNLPFFSPNVSFQEGLQLQ